MTNQKTAEHKEQFHSIEAENAQTQPRRFIGEQRHKKQLAVRNKNHAYGYAADKVQAEVSFHERKSQPFICKACLHGTIFKAMRLVALAMPGGLTTGGVSAIIKGMYASWKRLGK